MHSTIIIIREWSRPPTIPSPLPPPALFLSSFVRKTVYTQQHTFIWYWFRSSRISTSLSGNDAVVKQLYGVVGPRQIYISSISIVIAPADPPCHDYCFPVYARTMEVWRGPRWPIPRWDIVDGNGVLLVGKPTYGGGGGGGRWIGG